MKNKTVLKQERIVKGLVLCVFFFSCAVSLFAVDRGNGSLLVIQTKDGKTVRGELLMVKEDSLILMDSLNPTGLTLKIENIQKLVLKKKWGFSQGAGLGGMIGLTGGFVLHMLSGIEDDERPSFKGVRYGVLSMLVGGVIGQLGGFNESIDLDNQNPEKKIKILKKLNSKSRFPQRIPVSARAAESPSRAPGHPPDPGHESTSDSELLTGDNQASRQTKFRRFHLAIRPGHQFNQGVNSSKDFFRQIGFGDAKPSGIIDLYWFGGLSSTPREQYPQIQSGQAAQFSDFRLDFSLTRAFAVGIGFASLSRYSISGYHYLYTHTTDSTIRPKGIYLNERFMGNMYYISGSLAIIPDAFVSKGGIKAGICAGISDTQFEYLIPAGRSPRVQVKARQKNPAFSGFIELDYYINGIWSIGAVAEYRYLPVKVKSVQLTGDYDVYDAYGEITTVPFPFEIPAHKTTAGGLRLGLSLGLHF